MQNGGTQANQLSNQTDQLAPNQSQTFKPQDRYPDQHQWHAGEPLRIRDRPVPPVSLSIANAQQPNPNLNLNREADAVRRHPERSKAKRFEFPDLFTWITVVYGLVFWLLNAGDKILNGTSLGPVRWRGKNRSEQFIAYFDSVGLPLGLVNGALVLAGLVEVVIAFVFGYAVVQLLRKERAGAAETLRLAIAITVAVFVAFSSFDVLAGDRAELLEHGTFIGVFLVAHLVVVAEQAK